MASPELLPCPFCGGMAVMCGGPEHSEDFYAGCGGGPQFSGGICDARGPSAQTDGDAATAWNTRSDRAGLLAGLREAVNVLDAMPRPIIHGQWGAYANTPNVNEGVQAIRARIAALEEEAGR